VNIRTMPNPPTDKNRSQLVGAIQRAGWEASAAKKGELVQAMIDGVVAAGMGRRPGGSKRGSQKRQASPWPCPRCGPVSQADLSYSGSYHRTVVFADGAVSVCMPRLRCRRCRGSVAPELGPLLRKRQRQWHDVPWTVMEQYTNGLSYRSIRESLQRRGVYVGLSSLPPMMAAAQDVQLHAQPVQGRLQAAQADGAFWRVDGHVRAILHLIEVRPRAEPKAVGRHTLWFETGQIVASLVAPEESGDYWQLLMDEVFRRGWVGEQGDLFLTSDGNEGIRSAAAIVFGFGVHQRCTWHTAHRARDWAPTSCAAAVENSVHWAFNAPTHEELHERLRLLAQRWRLYAPQAVNSVLRKAPGAATHLVATDFPIRPKTAAIAERHNLEYKRRLRSTRGLFRDDNLAALVRLIDLKHNCARQPGADWLQVAARDLWPQPIQLHHSTAPPPPPPRPTATPKATAYTTRGT
jgi:transposase-like protein